MRTPIFTMHMREILAAVLLILLAVGCCVRRTVSLSDDIPAQAQPYPETVIAACPPAVAESIRETASTMPFPPDPPHEPGSRAFDVYRRWYRLGRAYVRVTRVCECGRPEGLPSEDEGWAALRGWRDGGRDEAMAIDIESYKRVAELLLRKALEKEATDTPSGASPGRSPHEGP